LVEIKEITVVSILAIIGLIFICWWLSKKLNKLGNFLDKLGDQMAENSVTKERTGASRKKALQNIKRAREKIQAIKGDGTDEQYNDAVQKEIEKLTNGSN